MNQITSGATAKDIQTEQLKQNFQNITGQSPSVQPINPSQLTQQPYYGQKEDIMVAGRPVEVLANTGQKEAVLGASETLLPQNANFTSFNPETGLINYTLPSSPANPQPSYPSNQLPYGGAAKNPFAVPIISGVGITPPENAPYPNVNLRDYSSTIPREINSDFASSVGRSIQATRGTSTTPIIPVFSNPYNFEYSLQTPFMIENAKISELSAPKGYFGTMVSMLPEAAVSPIISPVGFLSGITGQQSIVGFGEQGPIYAPTVAPEQTLMYGLQTAGWMLTPLGIGAIGAPSSSLAAFSQGASRAIGTFGASYYGLKYAFTRDTSALLGAGISLVGLGLGEVPAAINKVNEARYYYGLGKEAKMITNVRDVMNPDVIKTSSWDIKSMIGLGKSWEDIKVGWMTVGRPAEYQALQGTLLANPQMLSSFEIKPVSGPNIVGLNPTAALAFSKDTIEISRNFPVIREYGPTLLSGSGLEATLEPSALKDVFFTRSVSQMTEIPDLLGNAKPIQQLGGVGTLYGSSKWLSGERWTVDYSGVKWETSRLGEDVAGRYLIETKMTTPEGMVTPIKSGGKFLTAPVPEQMDEINLGLQSFKKETSQTLIGNMKEVTDTAMGGKRYYTEQYGVSGGVKGTYSAYQNVWERFGTEERGSLAFPKASERVSSTQTGLSTVSSTMEKTSISPLTDIASKLSEKASIETIQNMNVPKTSLISARFLGEETSIRSVFAPAMASQPISRGKQVYRLSTMPQPSSMSNMLGPSLQKTNVGEKLSLGTNVPTIIKTPTSTELKTETTTATQTLTAVITPNVPVPTTSFSPTITPPLTLPPVLFSPSFPDGSMFPKFQNPFRKFKRTYAYKPSIVGLYRGESLRRAPRGELSGLEIRPPVGKKRNSAFSLFRSLPSITSGRVKREKSTSYF